jgi:hypothetical protein
MVPMYLDGTYPGIDIGFEVVPAAGSPDHQDTASYGQSEQGHKEVTYE